ncbi:hypothetical protein JEQ12_019021 [Ovis aries]|uniref:Uncharacterized protein n=1 Tax=Ovis aries TaxID=9940 RepID=A0A836D3E9_SHEEP|nr:hypothetical protein JEQ12_019021 [Ovis aries]
MQAGCCSQAHVFPTQRSAQTPAAGLRSEGPLPTSSPVTRCWAVCLSSWLRKMFGAESYNYSKYLASKVLKS